MGLFAGIKEAQVTQGGVYIEPGLYTSRVEAVKTGKTRKGIPFFVVELTHLKSNNVNHPVGKNVSWMVMLNQDAALGNIKHFASVATETDEAEIDEAGIELIVSSENPLEGTLLNIDASNITTKAGTPFTKVRFLGIAAEQASA